MTGGTLLPFEQVWMADFEFGSVPGERPVPRCLVARELFTGGTLRLWQDELEGLGGAPYPLGPSSLFIAYYAVAELSCHLALGWGTPVNVLDLYVEFRNMTNGLELPLGRGLLGALGYFGIDVMGAAEKEDMRALALRGGDYTASEKRALVEYCGRDVDALGKLLPLILPRINLPQALIRGRFMPAAARIEHEGVPIDVEALGRLRASLVQVKDKLIARVDTAFGVYSGTTFKRDRFIAWLERNRIPWPLLPSGDPALDGDTFREMGRLYPAAAPLGGLRETLSDLRLAALAVGADGRNRCMLSAFASKTGRNQPSTTRFIFGPKVWLRGLIKPPAGCALAYLDFDQEEFGIAAALSGDGAMMDAYASGDAYLGFAKQAGAVPHGATKKSHRQIRERYKISSLGILYGMEPPSISMRINRPLPYAVELLQQHKRLYATYWRWSQAAVDHGMLLGHLPTVFGWTLHTQAGTKHRTLRNFPMQGNGSEILRLACIYATEAGVQVCAPVHDALLILAPVGKITEAVEATRSAMTKASAMVLSGFTLRVGGGEEQDLVRYPDRYMDDRGADLWGMVWELLAEIGG